MKSSRCAFVALLLVAGCSVAPIPAPSFVRSAGYVLRESPEVGRVPTSVEISKLEERLSALMAAPDRRVSFTWDGESSCPYPLSDYALRYRFEKRHGRVVIVGYAFHRSTDLADNMLHPPSDEVEAIDMSVFGGGSNYFTVVYDPKSSKVVELVYNAAL